MITTVPTQGHSVLAGPHAPSPGTAVLFLHTIVSLLTPSQCWGLPPGFTRSALTTPSSMMAVEARVLGHPVAATTAKAPCSYSVQLATTHVVTFG